MSLGHPDRDFSRGLDTLFLSRHVDKVIRNRVAGTSPSGSRRPIYAGPTCKSILSPLLRIFDSTYIIQRNVSAAEVRRKQEKAEAAKIAKKAREKEIARNAKNARNDSAGSSQLPQGSLAQQSGGAAQTQPSLEQVAIPASSTVPSPDTAHYTLFKFWPVACCTSAQHTDGHH